MGLTFDHVDLMPMTDAEKIRWLQPYLPAATEQVPNLFSPFTVQFVAGVLRSYPDHLLDEKSLPPFIHPLQLNKKAMPRAIANCFALVHMWMNSVAGSEAIILSTVRQEMERLSREVWLFPSVGNTPLTMIRTRQLSLIHYVPSKDTSFTY